MPQIDINITENSFVLQLMGRRPPKPRVVSVLRITALIDKGES